MARSAGKPVSADGLQTSQHSLLLRVLVKLFLSGLGARLPLLLWVGWIVGLALCELFDVVGTWWVGYWARQYEATDPSTVPIF